MKVIFILLVEHKLVAVGSVTIRLNIILMKDSPCKSFTMLMVAGSYN